MRVLIGSHCNSRDFRGSGALSILTAHDLLTVMLRVMGASPLAVLGHYCWAVACADRCLA